MCCNWSDRCRLYCSDSRGWSWCRDGRRLILVVSEIRINLHIIRKSNHFGIGHFIAFLIFISLNVVISQIKDIMLLEHTHNNRAPRCFSVRKSEQSGSDLSSLLPSGIPLSMSCCKRFRDNWFLFRLETRVLGMLLPWKGMWLNRLEENF